jgi:carbon storage regulator
MLVLDRRVHEGFWIDGGVYVKVLSVGRNRVKLGIQAPKETKVVRQELRERNGATPDEEGSLRPARRRN